MKQHFDRFEAFLKDVVKARAAHKKAMAELQAQAEKYGEQYDKDFLQVKRKELEQQARAYGEEAAEKAANLLQAIQDAAIERNSKLDLNDAALTNALRLVAAAGSNLGIETIKQINAPFIEAGNTPAIKALQAVYKSAGIRYDGGLDNYLYEPEAIRETFRNPTYQTFQQGGSLNQYAVSLSRLARKMGVSDFPTMIDDDGAFSAMRKAAHLP